MSTLGALLLPDTTFLLINFNATTASAGWTHSPGADDRLAHFSLGGHDQQDIHSGLNVEGLGLQVARAQSLTSHEHPPLLSAEILGQVSVVRPAVERLEAFAKEHPDLFGGNILLADDTSIAVTEYFGGKAQSEIIHTKGYLARANHSVFGLTDNATQDSVRRYDRMTEFLQELYAWGPVLDRYDIMDRAKAALLQPPLVNANTHASAVIDIQERRVDYKTSNTPWKTFSFLDTL